MFVNSLLTAVIFGTNLNTPILSRNSLFNDTEIETFNGNQVLSIIPDTLKVPLDGSDDAPSIQRAIAIACAGGSGVLRFLAHRYTLASAVSQPCAVQWKGQGWQEPNGGPGAAMPGLGTWFTIPDPSFTPVTISGPAASGSVFENFGIYQVHPAPSPGWMPIAYPYVFRVTGTNGEVTFRHIMGLAINRGITAYYAARLKIEDVRGQFFTNAIYADKNYDTTIINDARNWPYWSTNPGVMAYEQKNYDHIILGRVDDAFIDRVFSLPGRSTLKLITTAADGANPLNLPGGSPTNLTLGSIRSDFVKWTIWNTAIASQFDDLEISVASLVHQGAAWGGLTPLPGSAAIKNDGSFRLMSIGHLKADVLDASLIDASGAVGASTIQIGRAMVIFSHSKKGVCFLLNPGRSASNLQFSLPPAIDGGNNTVDRQPLDSVGQTSFGLMK